MNWRILYFGVLKRTWFTSGRRTVSVKDLIEHLRHWWSVKSCTSVRKVEPVDTKAEMDGSVQIIWLIVVIVQCSLLIQRPNRSFRLLTAHSKIFNKDKVKVAYPLYLWSSCVYSSYFSPYCITLFCIPIVQCLCIYLFDLEPCLPGFFLSLPWCLP